MNRWINQLRKWNKVYEDVAHNMIRIVIYDDESGHLEYDNFFASYDEMTVRLVEFVDFDSFSSVDPVQYRKDNPLGN